MPHLVPAKLALLIAMLSASTWLVIHVVFAFAVGSDAGNLPEGRRLQV